MGVTASCGVDGRPQGRRSATVALQQHQVWGHLVPQGLPLVLDDDIHYGSERPLSLAPAGASYQGQIADQVTQARAAGLTGMQILLMEGVNTGGDFVADWMRAADGTWQEGGAGFSVAPCLQVSSARGATDLVEQYAGAAAEHPSAARSDQALVVWVYNARDLTPGQWETVRRDLGKKSIEVFLVAELETAASQHHDTLDTSLIDPYRTTFDAVWLFDDKESEILDDFSSWTTDHGLPFAGGTLPGYDRETNRGGFVDARATEVWRTQLQRHLDSGETWMTAVTWNDAVEHSSVQPTTDWGVTRADLLAHHSALFRNVPQGNSEPIAYVSTPQYLVEGQELLAEGLLINHGPDPVTVRVRVVSAGGSTLAETTSGPAPAGGLAAAVVERSFGVRGGEHLYAEVDLLDASGTRLSRTRGAPVIVFAVADEAVPSPPRRRYYSLCSTAAADFSELADLERGEGDDAAPTGVQVRNGQSMRSVELLHNTWPAGLALQSNAVRYAEPPGTIVGGQEVTTVERGFTLARVVTAEGRIAYSPPVYHSAPGD